MNYFKKIITVTGAVIISFCSLFAANANNGADYQGKLNRLRTLQTTNDSQRYIKFTADGDTIYAEGFFADDTAEEFYISASGLNDIKSSFKIDAGGNFSAYFSASCNKPYGYAVVKLKSGMVLAYRAEYSGGWFFGDNGLAKENAERVENYMTADAETCAYYVNDLLDVEKTRRTLGEIRTIALEITEGIDDDYEKAKALNYWVAENIYYDMDTYDEGVTPETIALSNVLVTRKTVCGGYANILAALLEAAGIKAVNVKGGVVADGCTYEELLTKTVVHEWVAFFYDKEQRWVFADPGWDSGNIYEKGEFKYEPHGIKYFDTDGYAFSLNHRADRAEYREYFSANAFLQNYSENEEAEKPAENQPLISEKETYASQPSSKTERSREFDEQAEGASGKNDNVFFIVVIVVMSMGVLAFSALILTSVFNNKRKK